MKRILFGTLTHTHTHTVVTNSSPVDSSSTTPRCRPNYTKCVSRLLCHSGKLNEGAPAPFPIPPNIRHLSLFQSPSLSLSLSPSLSVKGICACCSSCTSERQISNYSPFNIHHPRSLSTALPVISTPGFNDLSHHPSQHTRRHFELALNCAVIGRAGCSSAMCTHKQHKI